MEILDVDMVCKAVKLKALFNRLTWYLVGIGGASSSSHHTLIHRDVGGRDSIAL